MGVHQDAAKHGCGYLEAVNRTWIHLKKKNVSSFVNPGLSLITPLKMLLSVMQRQGKAGKEINWNKQHFPVLKRPFRLSYIRYIFLFFDDTSAAKANLSQSPSHCTLGYVLQITYIKIQE
ncbi:hypothetical protein TNCV_1963441 [Trichonephila clavipes]|nr:hypothetical protein TNCV_1963441 [Trichonephila clavipes]